VPLSGNTGTVNSWNPLGHFRPVTGLLYLFLIKKHTTIYKMIFKNGPKEHEGI
jgi:hypothetical protein